MRERTRAIAGMLDPGTRARFSAAWDFRASLASRLEAASAWSSEIRELLSQSAVFGSIGFSSVAVRGLAISFGVGLRSAWLERYG